MRPTLIIIGAHKAGTTSLHTYLDSHPDIAMSSPKELNFFSNDKYWRRGVCWYERHFRSDAKIRGESSTSYTASPLISHVPARMHAIVPEAKLIYVVRDPIQRLISHFVHFVSNGREKRSFSEVLRAIMDGQGGRYLHQGLYFQQLQPFLPHYPRERILVVESEKLQRHREQALRTICDFLEIPAHFPSAAVEREENRGDFRFARGRWQNLVYPKWLQGHSRLPWRLKAPFHRLAAIGARPIGRPAPSAQETARLIDVFDSDVRQLRQFAPGVGESWLQYG